jgi:SAM-dependent methyltransferase
MHDTAMEYGELFFRKYLGSGTKLKVVDIGAQDVNGSLRDFAKPNHDYVGVDFVEGQGVDVIITDPYALPFADGSVDAAVCSSCFEHSEFFWLLFNEILRILRPSGVLYLNVPSNGAFHRYPVDCWRFYPDSGIALQNWARRSGYQTAMLESFTGVQKESMWNDFVAVFVKDEKHAKDHPNRITDGSTAFTNGLQYGNADFINQQSLPEDNRVNMFKHYAKKGSRFLKRFV